MTKFYARKLCLLVILILLMLFPRVKAQNFEKAYGGTGYEVPYATLQTTDQGYVIAGVTTSFGASRFDAYLVKTTPDGIIQWSKRYGGSEDDVAEDIKQTPDGGYIIAGHTRSSGAGSSDFFLIKTDAAGNVTWAKTYGGTGADQAFSVTVTGDGGYFVFGLNSGSFGQLFNSDYYMVKTDALGVVQWSKAIGVPNANTGDEGIRAKQTNDGGFALFGTTANSELLLIKLAANGDSVFSKKYTVAGGGAVAQDLDENADGSFIFTGYGNNTNNAERAFLLKTNNLGAITWGRKYTASNITGEQPTRAHGVTKVDDGYVFVGVGRPLLGTATGSENCLWVKTDLTGLNPITHMYGGNSSEIVYGRIRQTTDIGYIYSAVTFSYGAGDRDILLIKTDATGAVSTTGGECTIAEAQNSLQVADLVFNAADPVLVFTNNPATVTTNFTPFAVAANTLVAGVCPTIVLPLRLVSFIAQQNKNTVLLSWNTASEQGINKYVIERSANGGNSFSAIGEVVAKNGAANNYNSADFKPLAGKNFYRLKTIEKDGLASYSAVVLVDFNGGKTNTVSIVPNPVGNYAKIYIAAAGTNDLRFSLFDNAGRQVLVKTVKVNAVTDFYRNGLAKGVYYYKVLDGRLVVSTGKLVVE